MISAVLCPVCTHPVPGNDAVYNSPADDLSQLLFRCFSALGLGALHDVLHGLQQGRGQILRHHVLGMLRRLFMGLRRYATGMRAFETVEVGGNCGKLLLL